MLFSSACAASAGPTSAPDLASTPDATALGPCVGCDPGPRDDSELEVRFLGVGGFLLRWGGQAVLTAPLYSNPSFIEVNLGSVAPRGALVEELTAALPLDEVRGVLVGHGHYDHLMDVSALWHRLPPDARIYGNRTMKHMLAAFAPDRAPGCSGPSATPLIARDRVVAIDDPADDRLDRRVCPGGGTSAGAWITLPGGRVRVRALCSAHPAQFIGIHFGAGDHEADLCAPPTSAREWREGQTMAYLVDFLDQGRPAYRIYYQDAPTDAPVGHVPAEVLDEKPVDLALLCVGNFAEVEDQPGQILTALRPRYAIGGHWESFFQDQKQPIMPLPFHDVEEYRRRGDAILGDGGEAPLVVDGQATTKRHHVPMPGTLFRLTRAQ
jgi:glyoxylase-like metal-dependent hydrolase (beta-lactamase superfamily II)